MYTCAKEPTQENEFKALNTLVFPIKTNSTFCVQQKRNVFNRSQEFYILNIYSTILNILSHSIKKTKNRFIFVLRVLHIQALAAVTKNTPPIFFFLNP